MRITRREAEDALALTNVRAMLRVIRHGESDEENDDRAYRMRWPGLGQPPAFFDDFSRHPRIFEPTTGGRVSSAAGAYQITATTYDDFAPGLGISDFTPRSQDLLAVAIMAAEGALAALLAGRFDDAVGLLRGRWTSLPGAEENNPRWTLAAAREVYQKWGGTFAPSDTQPAAPIEERGVPYQPPKEEIMPFPLLAVLSTLAPFIPSLAKAFSDGSVKGQKIEALAPVISDAIVKVTGAVNLQDAAEKVQADPVQAQAADKAVSDVFYSLSEVGGGIEAARKFSTDVAAMNVSIWRMPSFIVTVILFPLIYFVVIMVLAGRGVATAIAASITTNVDIIDRVAIGFAISADMQNVVITAVIAGVLSGITGFFLGTSYGSQRKTDTALR